MQRSGIDEAYRLVRAHTAEVGTWRSITGEAGRRTGAGVSGFNSSRAPPALALFSGVFPVPAPSA